MNNATFPCFRPFWLKPCRFEPRIASACGGIFGVSFASHLSRCKCPTGDGVQSRSQRVEGDSRPSSRFRSVAPSSTEPESGESWEEGSEGGSATRSRPATSREGCPFSRSDQSRDCRGSSKLEAPIGERLDVCQRFLERARKRVISAESAIAAAVAEKDRLVAELEEGERRMDRFREEARTAPTQRDLVGEECRGLGPDDVAQMRQEILELRQFRDRFPASALRGADAPPVLENIPPTGIQIGSSHPQSAHGLLSKGAAKLAQLEERELAEVGQRDNRDTRAWKLFLLPPRMLLSRPPRGGRVPRKQLEERFQKFSAGQWAELIEASASLSTRGSEAAVRRRRRDQGDSISKRADRALELVQMGELSAGRVALEGAQIAPGDDATYKGLTDASRRPQSPERFYHSPSLRHTQKKNSSWMKGGLCSISSAADVGQRQGHFTPVPIRISVGIRTRSSDRSGSHQDGQDHCSEETQWGGAWHHRRGRLSQSGRENCGQTNGSEGGSSHVTISVRPGH